MTRRLAVLALLLATGMVVGCTPSATSSQDPGSLEGRWLVTGMTSGNGELNEPLADTTVTLSFEKDGVMGGSGGVNSFGGTYAAETDGSIELVVGQTTLMAGTPAADAQERRYLDLLGEVAEYVVSGDSLELRGEDGKTLLKYERSPQSSLTGTTWYCTGYNTGTGAVTSVSADSTMTAVFAEDGKLTGSSGVNTYGARYETGPGRSMSIGEISMTEMAGPPELMDQETAYLAALTKAGRYEITDDTLKLYEADGDALLLSYAAK